MNKATGRVFGKRAFPFSVFLDCWLDIPAKSHIDTSFLDTALSSGNSWDRFYVKSFYRKLLMQLF
jgi:hypothetical protein